MGKKIVKVELSSHYVQVTLPASSIIVSHIQHSELISDIFNLQIQIKPPLSAHPLEKNNVINPLKLYLKRHDSHPLKDKCAAQKKRLGEKQQGC